jgi:hypothetical protein
LCTTDKAHLVGLPSLIAPKAAKRRQPALPLLALVRD